MTETESLPLDERQSKRRQDSCFLTELWFPFLRLRYPPTETEYRCTSLDKKLKVGGKRTVIGKGMVGAWRWWVALVLLGGVVLGVGVGVGVGGCMRLKL